MPFTTRGFKNACHERATGVAIITSGHPVHATVVTEHAAAFPPNDDDECYVSVIVGTNGSTHRAVVASQYFALSYLSCAQVDIVDAIYNMRIKQMSKIRWSERHNVPYVSGSNAAVLCSLKQQVTVGPNTILVGHVLDVVLADRADKPLVNYRRTFRSVDDNAIPVRHPRHGRNPRL